MTHNLHFDFLFNWLCPKYQSKSAFEHLCSRYAHLAASWQLSSCHAHTVYLQLVLRFSMMVDKRALQLTAGFEFGTRVKTLFMSHSGLSQAMSYTRPSEAIHQKTGIFLANLHLIKIQAAWKQKTTCINWHHWSTYFSQSILTKKYQIYFFSWGQFPYLFQSFLFLNFHKTFPDPEIVTGNFHDFFRCSWLYEPWKVLQFILRGTWISEPDFMTIWQKDFDQLTEENTNLKTLMIQNLI